MLKKIRIPRHAAQLTREAAVAKRAMQMYYLLLDSGRFSSPPAEFAGQDAAQSVADAFGVSVGLVWQWIRDGQYSQS